MNDDAEVLQWIAFGGSLVSVWLYGYKDIRGAIAGVCTSVSFIAFGVAADLLAAILANFIFLILHIKNMRKTMDQDIGRIKKRLADSMSVIVKHSHAAAKNAGWWTNIETGEPLEPDVPQKLCLIRSEISEALEGYRCGLMDDKLPHRPMIEVELADAVIRIADLAGALGLDLGGALAEKTEFNITRPDHRIENRKKGGGKKF